MAIEDLAYNALAAPNNTGQMIGFTEPPEPTEVLPLRMYNFLLESIRHEDAQSGALFVKRFLEGPQQLWREHQARIFTIRDLWDLTKIGDDFLQYLKRIVGWTPDLDGITNELEPDLLRKLIGTSVPLWKKRGTEDAMLNALSLVTGARARLWNWFDFRWVLDETGVGEEHQGRDSWIIDLPGPPNTDEYRSNLRIVDDGTLNHTLVESLVKLVRAAGERIEVSYIDFMDLFTIKLDDGQWEGQGGSSLPIVGDGVAKLTDVGLQRVTTIINEALSWRNYVAYWRMRGDSDSVGNDFGGIFYWTDTDNYYLATLDTVDNKVHLKKVVAGAPTTIASFDYGSIGTLISGVYYGLRVEAQLEGATTRIKVFVDADETINTTDLSHTKGNIGVYHASGADDVEFDEIEMFQLPLDTVLIDINP